jgi:hypothetical protein
MKPDDASGEARAEVELTMAELNVLVADLVNEAAGWAVDANRLRPAHPQVEAYLDRITFRLDGVVAALSARSASEVEQLTPEELVVAMSWGDELDEISATDPTVEWGEPDRLLMDKLRRLADFDKGAGRG